MYFLIFQTNSLQDRTSTIYNLQRKTKTLKQQLESKDFQLSLSKKKISEFEEILKDKSRIANERDDTSLRHQKMQRKCEKLVDELQQHKEMVVQLKAKLMEYGELQVRITCFYFTSCSNHKGCGFEATFKPVALSMRVISY